MAESASFVTSASAEVMLVVQGAALALRPLLAHPLGTVGSSLLPLPLPSEEATAAGSVAPSSLIVAITPQSVIVINNSNNEVVRSFDVSKSSENEVKDAVFVASKRCFVVLTADGNVTIIPWECNDVKKLPKSNSSYSNISRVVLDESDRVFGFTTDNRLIEINVAAGGSSGSEKPSKPSSKTASGPKGGIAHACAVSGVGIVSVSSEAAAAPGTLNFDLWSQSSSSSTGKAILFESNAKVLSMPHLSSKYSWSVIDLSSDVSEFGTAYALLRGNLVAAEPTKTSKSKKSKTADVTSSAPLDLAQEVFSIVKLDADNDEILYARQLNCGSDSPTSLRLSGGFIWVLHQSGLLSAWGKRYGVPATRSSPFSSPEPLTLRLGAPATSAGETSKKSKSSGASGPVLIGFLIAVTPEDNSAFYVYSASASASNVTISKELISVSDSSIEASNSTAKVGSLASAIGSLAAAGISIFAASPAPILSTSEEVDEHEDSPNSVLAGLPRRHKRKLAAAQAKYDSVVGLRGKATSAPSEDKDKPTQEKDESKSNGRPVINFKSEAVQDFLRRLQNSLSEGAALMRSDWGIVKLLASTGSLSTTTYHELIESAMKEQRLDVLCEIAQHSPDLTEMQAVSIILYVLSCPDAAIAANKLSGGFLVFGQHERFEPAAPEAPKSKKSKKSAVESASASAGDAQSSSIEVVDPVHQRRLCVHAVMEAMVNRKCAFTSATLVEAIRRGLNANVCMVLVSVLWSMLRGFCSTNEVSVHLRELGDRQITLAINWLEALLDSHFLDFAVTLSSATSAPKKSKGDADGPSRLVSNVVRMMGKSIAGLDAAQSELEQVHGLWTHIQRCSSAGLGDAHTGLGGSQGPANSLYQVETLVL